MFDAADANSDGRLDRAEFRPFIEAVHNDRIARSIPNMSDPSQMQQAQYDNYYDLMNAINEASEGIAFEEIMDWWNEWRVQMYARVAELDAAEEQE